MSTTRITIRLGDDLRAAAEQYAAQHGLDLPSVVRLAMIRQLRQPPPKTLPEGVERSSGNPDIASHASAGAAKRWAKRIPKKSG